MREPNLNMSIEIYTYSQTDVNKVKYQLAH